MACILYMNEDCVQKEARTAPVSAVQITLTSPARLYGRASTNIKPVGSRYDHRTSGGRSLNFHRVRRPVAQRGQQQSS